MIVATAALREQIAHYRAAGAAKVVVLPMDPPARLRELHQKVVVPDAA